MPLIGDMVVLDTIVVADCTIVESVQTIEKTGVVIMIGMTTTILARLKDRDYDVTPRIILILSLIFAPNPY